MCCGLLTAVIFVSSTHLATAAGNGEACSSHSDCTVEHQKCRGLDYFTDSTCNMGLCDCDDASYIWSSDRCKNKKYNGSSCTDATDKCMTGTCASGTCSCASGYTYNSNLGDCLSNSKKLLGDDCTSNADCYGDTGTVICDTTCKCGTGYIREAYKCRPPHVGETCIATNANPPGVNCASMLSADPSLATETCQSGTCACPSSSPGSTYVTHSIENETFKLCVVNFNGTRKNDGASCDSHNSCKSYYCAACPGSTAKTCIRIASNGSGRHFVSWFTLTMAVVSALLLQNKS